MRTRVGYAGGTIESPTYRKMGDHTETIQVDFDRSLISYEELLDHFWDNHYAVGERYGGRQYMSLLLYHTEPQKEAAIKKRNEIKKQRGTEIITEISPFMKFYIAEDYHQKYYLKRYPSAVERLSLLYPDHEDFVNGTLVARLNGLVKGFGTLRSIKDEIESELTSHNKKQHMLDVVESIKW
ncbi:peptide-methionine (S)-S-oxide reductase [Bacillus shivajii]|uniref:peptide-methionine (S)-S-oxide reductase n=1 Tax=Bacillus shivajii TaxID=1983719 RepID=UPI001CFC0CF5|nr:peptide-methionine (S)-S-oxide reductase [Bacillus shivajii]UCZ55376.1 peptide-methionine (S)-S-oxide reductase [Bacillus shivajii]